MKITKIQIRSYRGISALEAEISPAGAVVKGANGRGKTSVIRAVRAALAAQDIAADAIKLDADKAEILVDLNDVSVRRVITAKGSNLTVEKAGMKASKPTAYLNELLGGCALDPLELYLAKPKERKALVLAALPVAVTKEQIAKYVEPFDLPLDFDATGHGLDVVGRAHKYFYAERTAANKDAADALRNAERLAAEAKTAAEAVTPGPVLAQAEVKVAITAAERELLSLENRASEAEEAARRTAAQRERIETLRGQAKDVEASAPVELVDTTELDDLVVQAAESVRVLEEELASSRAALAKLQADLSAAKAANDTREKAKLRAADLHAQADTLAAALAAATVVPPTESELAAARTKLSEANANAARADLQAKAMAAVEAANTAKNTAAEMQVEADDLDATVKRLANDVPTELLASAKGIPGLTIDGDEVLLEGKRLDGLCGAEQLKFAVDIARRANAKTKILLVDGLERLDPDQMDAFVAYATSDDWQLIGTRVDRGEVVIEAIEPEVQDKAAE